MTITFSFWMIPALLTLAIWAAVVLWPMRPARGDYDFGPALDALFRAAGAFIATLLVWLIFLAIMLFIAS